MISTLSLYKVIMKMLLEALFIIVLTHQCLCNDGFICRSISDAVDFKSSTNSDERIIALEEQVRQLQKLVGVGNVSAPHTKIDGIPRDCSDIHESGIKLNGVYLISPDGRCPFYVFCEMSDGGWTVIQRRQDGSVNFYQPWNEYVKGFGDIDGEYWLGLDRINRLTKEGSQIYFYIENYDGTTDYAHYQTFAVHGATTAYRMNVDPFGYKGSIAELLSYHDNMKFSTFDRDNDISGINCCEKHLNGGGWWYNSCYRLGNVNGVFGKNVMGGIGYWTTSSKNVPIKKVHIKVKPRSGLC